MGSCPPGVCSLAPSLRHALFELWSGKGGDLAADADVGGDISAAAKRRWRVVKVWSEIEHESTFSGDREQRRLYILNHDVDVQTEHDGRFLYPGASKPGREWHADVRELAELAETAKTDLRILVVLHDPAQLLLWAIRMGGEAAWGGFTSLLQVLVDSTHILQSQLEMLDPGFVHCMDMGHEDGAPGLRVAAEKAEHFLGLSDGWYPISHHLVPDPRKPPPVTRAPSGQIHQAYADSLYHSVVDSLQLGPYTEWDAHSAQSSAHAPSHKADIGGLAHHHAASFPSSKAASSSHASQSKPRRAHHHRGLLQAGDARVAAAAFAPHAFAALDGVLHALGGPDSPCSSHSMDAELLALESEMGSLGSEDEDASGDGGKGGAHTSSLDAGTYVALRAAHVLAAHARPPMGGVPSPGFGGVPELTRDKVQLLKELFHAYWQLRLSVCGETANPPPGKHQAGASKATKWGHGIPHDHVLAKGVPVAVPPVPRLAFFAGVLGAGHEVWGRVLGRCAECADAANLRTRIWGMLHEDDKARAAGEGKGATGQGEPSGMLAKMRGLVQHTAVVLRSAVEEAKSAKHYAHALPTTKLGMADAITGASMKLAGFEAPHVPGLMLLALNAQGGLEQEMSLLKWADLAKVPFKPRLAGLTGPLSFPNRFSWPLQASNASGDSAGGTNSPNGHQPELVEESKLVEESNLVEKIQLQLTPPPQQHGTQVGGWGSVESQPSAASKPPATAWTSPFPTLLSKSLEPAVTRARAVEFGATPPKSGMARAPPHRVREHRATARRAATARPTVARPATQVPSAGRPPNPKGGASASTARPAPTRPSPTRPAASSRSAEPRRGARAPAAPRPGAPRPASPRPRPAPSTPPRAVETKASAASAAPAPARSTVPRSTERWSAARESPKPEAILPELVKPEPSPITASMLSAAWPPPVAVDSFAPVRTSAGGEAASSHGTSRAPPGAAPAEHSRPRLGEYAAALSRAHHALHSTLDHLWSHPWTKLDGDQPHDEAQNKQQPDADESSPASGFKKPWWMSEASGVGVVGNPSVGQGGPPHPAGVHTRTSRRRRLLAYAASSTAEGIHTVAAGGGVHDKTPLGHPHAPRDGMPGGASSGAAAPSALASLRHNHVNLRMLASMMERAGGDLRVVVLLRDAREMVRALHRDLRLEMWAASRRQGREGSGWLEALEASKPGQHGPSLEELRVLQHQLADLVSACVDGAYILSAQLQMLDPRFFGCVDMDALGSGNTQAPLLERFLGISQAHLAPEHGHPQQVHPLQQQRFHLQSALLQELLHRNAMTGEWASTAEAEAGRRLQRFPGWKFDAGGLDGTSGTPALQAALTKAQRDLEVEDRRRQVLGPLKLPALSADEEFMAQELGYAMAQLRHTCQKAARLPEGLH